MRWFGGFVALPGGDPRRLTWGHFLRGFLAVLKADPAAARPPLDAAIRSATAADQPNILVEALAMASVAESLAGDAAAARRLLDQAAAAMAGQDYPAGAMAVLQARALHGFAVEDLAVVRSSAEEAARLAEEHGDRYVQGVMLLNLGSAELIDGALTEASPLLAGALRIARELDDRVGQFFLLDALGCHAGMDGRPRLAAKLFGAAATVGA